MDPENQNTQPPPVTGMTESIVNGLSGAFSMARADPEWASRMDMSPAAVFRSFYAIPLAIPGLLLATEASRRIAIAAGQDVPPMPLLVFDRALTSLVVWGLVVFFYMQVAQRLGSGWRLSPLLIANNYATFLGYSLLGIGMGLSMVLGAGQLLGWIFPMVMALGLWLDWGMLRRALGLEKDMAIVTIIFVQVAAIIISVIVGSVISVVLSAFGYR